MQSQGLGNSARLQWWRWRKALGSVGGGLAFFAWCSTRMLETGFWDKTWCLGGWGPIQQGKGKKRVESLREGEGEEGNYASIGLHWIRQSPNSSGFSLRCNRVNGLEISEAATVRTRTDISILSTFSLKYHIAYVQDGHALHCACWIKGDVSGDKLALLWADGRIGRVSAGLEH